MNYDLTRWNRAGLKKFRYVDDNAATLLEALRRDLHGRFPSWTDLPTDGPPDETTAQRNRRLERQYARVAREWGWEIARSFARAAHVLTEHLDASANEGYLGTATQWENVRQLVAMIGYRPAPQASAATLLVLLAKPGVNGLVARGFQAMFTPKAGAPVLFETLEELTVDAGFNEMRLAGWNRSTATMTGAIWQLSGKQEVSAGAPAILRNEATGMTCAVRISAVGVERQYFGRLAARDYGVAVQSRRHPGPASQRQRGDPPAGRAWSGSRGCRRLAVREQLAVQHCGDG
jgi:hypothetical protein